LKDKEEIFKEIKDLVEETYSIHAKNLSNENTKENENIVRCSIRKELQCSGYT
jgi:hypothetical protein